MCYAQAETIFYSVAHIPPIKSYPVQRWQRQPSPVQHMARWSKYACMNSWEYRKYPVKSLASTATTKLLILQNPLPEASCISALKQLA